MTPRNQKEYYSGGESNYIFGYNILKHRIFWGKRIKAVYEHKKNGALLDVGCAFGYFIKHMTKDFEAYGIDSSDYAISRAREVVSDDRLAVADAQTGIPFKKRFDVITAFDVMEHITNIEGAFRNFREKLERGGVLIMEFPIKKTPINRDKTHIYRPLDEYIRTLKKVGFKEISVKHYYTIGSRAVMIPTKVIFNYCQVISSAYTPKTRK